MKWGITHETDNLHLGSPSLHHRLSFSARAIRYDQLRHAGARYLYRRVDSLAHSLHRLAQPPGPGRPRHRAGADHGERSGKLSWQFHRCLSPVHLYVYLRHLQDLFCQTLRHPLHQQPHRPQKSLVLSDPLLRLYPGHWSGYVSLGGLRYLSSHSPRHLRGAGAAAGRPAGQRSNAGAAFLLCHLMRNDPHCPRVSHHGHWILSKRHRHQRQLYPLYGLCRTGRPALLRRHASAVSLCAASGSVLCLQIGL